MLGGLPPFDRAGVGDALFVGDGFAGAVDGADVVEARVRVVHDDGGPLLHVVRESVYLARAGGDLALALVWMRGNVRDFDLVAAHGGDVGPVEVPADAYVAAFKPVGSVHAAASRADHPSSHGSLAFQLAYACIIALCRTLLHCCVLLSA